MILDALKKRLHEKDQKHLGKWLKELLAMVWGLRTQPSRNTGVSPYFLLFGSEAMLPVDVAFRLPRIKNYDEENNDQAQQDDVDRLEEECLVTCVCTAKYLDSLCKYFNHNIQERSFAVGDMVLYRKQRPMGCTSYLYLGRVHTLSRL